MSRKLVFVIVALVVIAGVVFYEKEALAPIKRGDDGNLNNNENNMTMMLKSDAFLEGEFIPPKYTCDADNTSPKLIIFGVPEEAKSLVLVMDDPDVPKERRPSGVFDHWVLYNIPPSTKEISENSIAGTPGNNGRGEAKYTGPCPPPEYQPTTHRYFFKLFATDIANLNFIKAPTKDEILGAIEGHIIGEAVLMGRYDRTKNSSQQN